MVERQRLLVGPRWSTLGLEEVVSFRKRPKPLLEGGVYVLVGWNVPFGHGATA